MVAKVLQNLNSLFKESLLSQLAIKAVGLWGLSVNCFEQTIIYSACHMW